ncbi:MAG: FecR domain-containing protein [Pseudomonadota bacterium]
MSWRNLDYSDEIEEVAMEWRLRVSAGDLTSEEKVEFASWRAADPRHEDAYDQAVSLWAALGTIERGKLNPSLYNDVAPSRAWRFFADAPKTLWKGHRGWALGSLAATAAIFAITIAGHFRAPHSATIEIQPVVTTYASGLGETKTITLADRSILTLGAASEVEVALSEGERRVTLASGAVVFDVSSNPDRPFIVRAENFTAKVVGTVFDVRNSAGVVRLSVSEGEVEVAHPLIVNDEPSSMISAKRIVAGQKISATSSGGLSHIETLRQEDFATWREARLRYQNVTLAELIADANRYSEQKIVLSSDLKSYSNDRATMIFDGNDIERLIKSLPTLFPVNVEESSDGEILITLRQTED